MSCDHLFIDLEVAGLAESRSLAIQRSNVATASTAGGIGALAAVRTDDRGKVLGSVADTATTFRDIHQHLTKLASGDAFVVIAVFPETKKKVLKDACAYFDLSDPFKGKPWLDFSQVAWPLAVAGHVANRSLRSVGEHFKVLHDAPGTVTGDCALLCSTYWEMMRRYRTALTGEEAVRELGGETLAAVRKFVGF